jgi:hypothetical protein
MPTSRGRANQFGDSVTRRDFLKAGALGLGGLTLANVLRLRAGAGEVRSPKSVIMVCLAGGPSHIDMYDLKPHAPAEVRGDFRPIPTNVPGFDLCELMPLQATIADKLSLVRTVRFVEPMQHELQECYSGYPKSAKRPTFGSVVARCRDGHERLLPPYVSLDEYAADHFELEHPRYVGGAYRPFLYGGESMRSLGLAHDFSPGRLAGRRQLAQSFNDQEGLADAAALDPFQAQALEIITSDKARRAFDLSREPAYVRELYGSKDAKYIYGNEPKATVAWPAEKFLLARRLVEAGVSVVTMRVGTWDYHGTTSGTGYIFTGLRSQLPLLDRSIHALVTDLHERGLEQDVAVLVWGEFGRTPKVNNVGGRDHWPDTGFALFAGGGLRMGQVVGETDRLGALPKCRPLGPQDVLATVYHVLGIDPSLTLPGSDGRPLRLLDDGQAIAELI